MQVITYLTGLNSRAEKDLEIMLAGPFSRPHWYKISIHMFFELCYKIEINGHTCIKYKVTRGFFISSN
jgi:hypothetical protein